MGLRFSEIEAVLARLEGATEERRVKTVRARLQQLHRLGIPRLDRRGSGRHLSYGGDAFFQLVFTLQLLKRGLSAEQAKLVLVERGGWVFFQAMIGRTLERLASGDVDGVEYACIRLDALAHWRTDEERTESAVGIMPMESLLLALVGLTGNGIPADELPEFRRQQAQARRLVDGAMLIEVNAVIVRALNALHESGFDPSIFRDAVPRWQEMAEALNDDWEAARRLYGATSGMVPVAQSFVTDHEPAPDVVMASEYQRALAAALLRPDEDQEVADGNGS